MEYLCCSSSRSNFFYIFLFKKYFNYQDYDKAKEIFLKILDDETTNKMPLDIIEEAKKNFDERLQNINWDTYS